MNNLKPKFIKIVVSLILALFITLPGFTASNNKHNLRLFNFCNNPTSVNQSINFTDKSFNIKGLTPIDIDSADFNNDDISDLIILGNKDLSILYGNKDGSYTETKSIDINSFYTKVYINDLNNDNSPDIILLSNSNFLTTIINNKNNGFSKPVNFQTGDSPISVTFGDFDNNATLDCFVVNSSSKNGSLILNPSKQFPSSENLPSESITLSGELSPNHVTSADFNSDGNLDVAISFDENKIIVFQGDSKGFFIPSDTLTLTTKPLSISATDLNDDKKIDLIIPVTSNKVGIASGLPGGDFLPVQYYPVAGSPISALTGNFNSDCKPDIITGNNTNNISILKGIKKGGFAPSIEFSTNSIPFVLKKVDLNADKLDDLILITTDGEIKLLFQTTQSNPSSNLNSKNLSKQ